MNNRAAQVNETSLLLGWPAIYNELTQKGDSRQFVQKLKRKHVTNLKKYSEDGHLVTFAPTGSGKGVSVIIPNLLHYSGPSIVIDPKGENFEVTAEYRRKVLNQTILLLDPFKSVPQKTLSHYNIKRSRLNPLSLSMLSDTSVDNDAQMIAEMFADGGGNSKEPFWDLCAKQLLSGILAHEMNVARMENREPSFKNVINILYDESDPVYKMAKLLDSKEKPPSSFVLKTIGSAFLSLPNETRGGVLITAQSYLSILITGNLLYYFDNSTIDLNKLKTREDYTLYIVIPPNKLQSHQVVLKMWVGVLMYTIMERTKLPKKRTLFMLDECANLGELDVLRKAVTLLRGYGLQVWMFFQDISQMKELYGGDFNTMINNCGIVQAFGISRQLSASSLSKILGRYSATELLKLDKSEQVLSIAPAQVEIYRLMKYYRDKIFENKFNVNRLITSKIRIKQGNWLRERKLNLRF